MGLTIKGTRLGGRGLGGYSGSGMSGEDNRWEGAISSDTSSMFNLPTASHINQAALDYAKRLGEAWMEIVPETATYAPPAPKGSYTYNVISDHGVYGVNVSWKNYKSGAAKAKRRFDLRMEILRDYYEATVPEVLLEIMRAPGLAPRKRVTRTGRR